VFKIYYQVTCSYFSGPLTSVILPYYGQNAEKLISQIWRGSNK